MAPRPLNITERQILDSYEICTSRIVPMMGRPFSEWRDIRPCYVQHCWLYRLFDEAKDLLYIGITGRRLGDRFTQHRRSKTWWPDVAFVNLECHPAEHKALIAERSAIMTERPRFNRRSAVD